MTALLVRKRLCVIVYSDGGRGLCVFGGLCVDMWRLVHQYSFFCCFDCLLTVFDDWYSVPFIKNSQQSKYVQSKQQKWPLVYQSSHVYTESAEYTKPRKLRYLALKMKTSITCAWDVATARRPWTGLTLYVYVDVHASGSRSLPRAAIHSHLLMMPAARLVCQRPSSNLPYFRTPLANFLLSRPNSVEYGNSKTTTLLHSAKYTRPLFQNRTGCGGRPSGWHDIVTCQHLVYYGRPLGVAWAKSIIFCQCFFKIFLWPPYSPALVNGGSRKFYTWWNLSVIREVTTWIFSWSSLNYRVGQKVT